MAAGGDDDRGGLPTAPVAREAGTATAVAEPGARPRGPVLAEGVQLIGEYEGSGFKEAPYIARRADGQVVQLTHLLYLVAEAADGGRTDAEIAERVGKRFGRTVSADNVSFLVDRKLRPLGVLAAADGSSPEVDTPDPLLALRFRAALVSERATQRLTGAFKPLFLPPVVAAVLAGFVAMDVWVFGVHGVAQSTRQLIYQPAYLLMMLALVALSAGFHELGHAAGCRYGGGRPGVMGAGIYVVWPAFYTDVTDAYRLDRRGRLRTDLGGVYFNMIFSLATFGTYLATGFEPLLIVIPIQHLQIVHQLLPFLRLDGYYILADLTGVPDLFTRIRPTLVALLPGRKADERVTALKPWVRVVVTVWVLVIIPVLAWMFLTMAVSAPRIVATAADSLGVQLDKVSGAFGEGDAVAALAGIFSMVALVLPLAGMAYTFTRVGRRIGAWAWSGTEGRPLARVGVAAAAAAVALLAWLWIPDGDYRPIQPGEKGTIQGSLLSLRSIPGGRPGLTAEREAELDAAREGAPGAAEGPAAGEPAGATSTGSSTTTTTTGAGPAASTPVTAGATSGSTIRSTTTSSTRASTMATTTTTAPYPTTAPDPNTAPDPTTSTTTTTTSSSTTTVP